jgi:hypothetical protein
VSYRADQAIRMFSRARYFHVTVYPIRSGAEADFGELIRLRRFNLDGVNLDRPDLAWRAVVPKSSFTSMLATYG